MYADLKELHNTNLPMRVISYRIRRNIAIGAGPKYKIDDLITVYDSFEKIKNLETWANSSKFELLTMLVKMKTRALLDITRKGQLSNDPDEKRNCLIDAIRMEKELMELINGRR